jgi:uncharacterized protein
MEKRSQYIIQFASLPTGEHSYEFHITDKFFESFEHSLINKADVQVKVVLLKGMNNLQLSFTFQGGIHVTCVRCLDEFDMPVNEVRHLMVRLLDEVDKAEEEEEDILKLPLTAHELDLATDIYDYLNLMVPLNPIHPDKKDGSSGCNENAIKEMNSHLLNADDKPDPRWDILKNLKLK